MEPLTAINPFKFVRMKHRGQYMKQLIKKSGSNFNDVHFGLAIGRTTLYRWLQDPNLSFINMAKIAEFIGEDISQDFPKAIKAIEFERSKEFNNEMDPQTIREKYFALLEKHNELLEKYMMLKSGITGTESGPNE